MFRTLRGVALLLAVALPAMAAPRPGSITGYVRDSAGVPQIGAMVEVFALHSSDVVRVFTDQRGFYTAPNLSPGAYDVKVSAPTFLPSLREDLSLGPGARLVVNLTLSTLFEAVQFLPSRPRGPEDEDDWKWTLRSSANRPILRLTDGRPIVVSGPDAEEDGKLRAQLMFLAGSNAEGFGGTAPASTAFQVEHSLFSTGRISLNGNVGYGAGAAAAVVRAAYRHRFSNGSEPEFALTMRRFGTPSALLPEGALEAVAFSVADTTTLADAVELSYGGELQTIQFQQRVSAFRPFGAVTVHLTPNTVVEYRYATSLPSTRLAKGFDTAPPDLSESNPRLSLVDSQPALERAQHQEVAVSRRFGRNSFQVAYFSDHVQDAALVGVGEVAGPDFLPDVYSGTFSYHGGDLETDGVRVVMQRKLSDDVTATLGYAYGGVIELQQPGIAWHEVNSHLRTTRRHSVAAKVAGRIPGAGTRWIASYKWLSGQALTPVDVFNASAGEADPFFNLFIRQPIPSSDLLPGQIEALVDLRNLLAQGYVPVIGPDGQVVYLVQTARSVRGGVAFVF